MNQTTRRTAAEIIAVHFCSDITDIRDGLYQRYRPSVYVVGNDYYCAPAVGQKPPREAPGEPWRALAEYYGRTIYVSDVTRSVNLYHGTSTDHLEAILKQGLQPRGDRPGNWEENPSRRDHVYLTNSYPVFFARCTEGDNLVVVQIDTTRLRNHLYADEDALESFNGGKDDMPGTMETRTAFYRDNWRTLEVAKNWKSSLAYLGTCSHYGTIPSKAITKVAIFKRTSILAHACDPTITRANYSILGPYYRWITEVVFMGDKAPYETGKSPISDSYRERVIQAGLFKQPIEIRYRPQNGWV